MHQLLLLLNRASLSLQAMPVYYSERLLRASEEEDEGTDHFPLEASAKTTHYYYSTIHSFTLELWDLYLGPLKGTTICSRVHLDA